jgi:hypothetical protein
MSWYNVQKALILQAVKLNVMFALLVSTVHQLPLILRLTVHLGR